MGKVLAFVNHKGGVGKTAISLNLAAVLAHRGHKVLLIDADPHANATRTVAGVLSGAHAQGLTDALFHDGPDVSRFIVDRTAIDGVHLIGGSLRLMDVPDHLRQTSSAPGGIFVKKMHFLRGVYDYILLDNPSSLTLLPLVSLVAADAYFVPMQGGDAYGMTGIGDLGDLVDEALRLNPSLSFGGAILNRFNPRLRVHQWVREQAVSCFGTAIRESVIPEATVIGMAAAEAKTVMSYGASSVAARAFGSLADEVGALFNE